jgi:aspartate racemase
MGKILDSSKHEYLRIIQLLSDAGAEAVILGCTEIGMLVEQNDTKTKLFDTTTIHAEKAVESALGAQSKYESGDQNREKS